MKSSRKDCKMNVQARCEAEKSRTDKSFSLFPLQKKNSNKDSNYYTESGKKTFAEISQRMISEIMFAFIEVAEIKAKNSDKRALSSIKCSRGALSIVNKIENCYTKREKNYFHL